MLFCKNTIIIKIVIIYFMTYSKYVVLNINGFLLLKVSKNSYFQKDRPESWSGHFCGVILMSPSQKSLTSK